MLGTTSANVSSDKGTRPEVIRKNDVPKNFAKITGEHLFYRPRLSGCFCGLQNIMYRCTAPLSPAAILLGLI